MEDSPELQGFVENALAATLSYKALTADASYQSKCLGQSSYSTDGAVARPGYLRVEWCIRATHPGPSCSAGPARRS